MNDAPHMRAADSHRNGVGLAEEPCDQVVQAGSQLIIALQDSKTATQHGKSQTSSLAVLRVTCCISLANRPGTTLLVTLITPCSDSCKQGNKFDTVSCRQHGRAVPKRLSRAQPVRGAGAGLHGLRHRCRSSR